MKIKPITGEASHLLQLTRAEAFEVLQFLAMELANERQHEIQIAIFDDENQ